MMLDAPRGMHGFGYDPLFFHPPAGVAFFWLMHHGEVGMIMLGQLGFAVAVGMFVGTQPTAMVEAAPGHAMLVKKLFFEPLPDELVAPFTAALEHIQASLNLNASLPPVPL